MYKRIIWDVMVNVLYISSLTYVLFQQAFIGRIGFVSFINAAIFSVMSALYGYTIGDLKRAIIGYLSSVVSAIIVTTLLVRYPIEVNVGNLAAELVTMYSLRNVLMYVIFILTPLSIIFMSVGIYLSQR